MWQTHEIIMPYAKSAQSTRAKALFWVVLVLQVSTYLGMFLFSSLAAIRRWHLVILRAPSVLTFINFVIVLAFCPRNPPLLLTAIIGGCLSFICLVLDAVVAPPFPSLFQTLVHLILVVAIYTVRGLASRNPENLELTSLDSELTCIGNGSMTEQVSSGRGARFMP